MRMSNRDNFSTKVKNAVAARAGWRSVANIADVYEAAFLRFSQAGLASRFCWRIAAISVRALGRQTGERPKSDRLAPKVGALMAEGRSYRWIAHDLGISKNTVADIAKRQQSRA